MADKLRITLVKSTIGAVPKKQKNSRSFRFKKTEQNSGNA